MQQRAVPQLPAPLSNLSQLSLILSQKADDFRCPFFLGPALAKPWNQNDHTLLDHYGSQEAMQQYPPLFQTALRPRVHRPSIESLLRLSSQILFVYGSLMISELMHDAFNDDISKSIFLDPIVQHSMCPASVGGYQRYAVNGDDEPIMKKARGEVHGMLIFGLTADNFRVLDDYYLSRGFENKEVRAKINLTDGGSYGITPRAYVWPQRGADTNINHGLNWTVARFWEMSRVCNLWRNWKADPEMEADRMQWRKQLHVKILKRL